jgi:hypothetical protein
MPQKPLKVSKTIKKAPAANRHGKVPKMKKGTNREFICVGNNAKAPTFRLHQQVQLPLLLLLPLLGAYCCCCYFCCLPLQESLTSSQRSLRL